jgi:hypothetical protein
MDTIYSRASARFVFRDFFRTTERNGPADEVCRKSLRGVFHHDAVMLSHARLPERVRWQRVLQLLRGLPQIPCGE